jgi:hypothetical protein
MVQDQLDIGKELESSIRDYRKTLGNSNQELNKSINLLSQINDLRDSSIAKVKALNKESINTREIQKEYNKAREKQELTLTKLKRLQQSMSAVQKQDAEDYVKNLGLRATKEEEIRRAKLQGNTALRDELSAQLQILETKIRDSESLEKGFNIDQMRYAAALQSNKVSAENVNFLEEELKLEKELKSEVGFTGLALGKISQTLGFGTKAYEKMVEKARDLKEENEKISFGDKFKAVTSTIGDAISETFKDPVLLTGAAVGAYKLVEKGLTKVGDAAASSGKFLAGLSQDSSNLVRGLTSGLSDIARQIPLIGGLLGGFIDGISAVLDLVIGVDNFIIKSGRDLNLNTQEARALNREFQNISFNSGNVFTTSRKLLESQVELSNQLGVVNRLTTEQLETNIMLKDIAGLELETRQQIVEASTITGQTSENVVKSVLAQVKGLKDATGIQLQNKQVLKEAANLGGYLGLQFAKFPANLTKSLVTVKAMGMELKQLDSIADSFLDFESSISKEFEAQLLTGKDINLAKAREAFLNNDLATAASEITRQVGSANDFLKLNRIQAESLASAFGMSRDQMGEMLKRQELLSKLGAKDTDNAQKQLQLGLQKFQNQKALTAAIGEEAYQNLVNASTQEKMASFIEKIKQSIVDFVERSGIIEKIQGFIDYIAKPENIKKILVTVRDTFADIAEVVLAITNGVINAIDAVTLGFGIEEDFERKFEKFSEEAPKRIRSMGGNFEALTVGDNAANSQIKNSAANNQAPVDNMSMRGNANQNVTLNAEVKAYIVETKRDNEAKVQRSPNLDIQTGK